MGTVGFGSSVNAAFNLTSMTRGEAVNAAQKLRSGGKLSGDEAAVLDGFACAYAAAPGEQLPAQYSMTDPTKYNFLDIIQQASFSDHAHGSTLAAANDDALLEALTNYQNRSNGDDAQKLVTYF